jgi:hypothetical protein
LTALARRRRTFISKSTAYDILRHCGVEIGKRDFLGRS